MGEGKKSKEALYGWLMACVFFLLMLSFIFDIWGDKKYIRDNPIVDEIYYTVDPVRHPHVSAETQRAGFQYNCNECHQDLDPPEVPEKLIGAHEEIVLHHESAMTCYTCHSRDNRERLNDIYGTEVLFEESENICHRCHGPRYRDWKLGIHGRPLGHWDAAKGEKTNITCVYCHNPHAPAFKPMKPSPPPIRDNFITGKEARKYE